MLGICAYGHAQIEDSKSESSINISSLKECNAIMGLYMKLQYCNKPYHREPELKLNIPVTFAPRENVVDQVAYYLIHNILKQLIDFLIKLISKYKLITVP